MMGIDTMPRRRRGSSKAPKLGGPILGFLLIVGVLATIFGEKPTQSVSAPPVLQSPDSGGAAAPRDRKHLDLALGGGPAPGEAPPSGNPGTNRIAQEADVSIAKAEVPATTESPNNKVQGSVFPNNNTEVSRFIKGRGVALRDGPGKQFGILDRYDAAREVILLGSKGEWAQIRDKLTQREGWVSTSLLSDRKPKQQAEPEDGNRDDPPRKPTVSAPQISDATIVQRIIAQSLSMYPGSCACPYNTDRGGRRCGKRSAYNRRGGYAPICFAGDISREMIAGFRKQDGQ
ncbi:SH3 domain-containing protein [Rhizobium laguerreae]|uniref:SH3 domain-containing protein n=1 Tax=Rhizobium laguerreae TaxID=1076926 RepID=UPI003AAB9F05